MVARHVAGVSVGDLALRVREHVPHALAAATVAYGALDLVAGGRRAPEESGRELDHLAHRGSVLQTVRRIERPAA